MLFSITKPGKPRLGLLSELKSNFEAIYETPLFVVSTKYGNVPHLTKDVFHKVLPENCIINIPSSQYLQFSHILEAYKRGVAKFTGLHSHSVSTSLLEPCSTRLSGTGSVSYIYVYGKGGRQVLDSQRYVSLIEAMQPDWYEAIHDSDTNSESSKKRVLKSALKSKMLVEENISLHNNKQQIFKDVALFGPLLGGHDKETRKEWAEDMLPHKFSGLSIVGISSGGMEEIDPLVLSQLAAASLEPVSKKLPIQCYGSWSPLCVLELMECGIDIFDSSLPTLNADKGIALNLQPDANREYNCYSTEDTELKYEGREFKLETSNNTECFDPPKKVPRLNENGINRSNGVSECETTQAPSNYKIIVNADRFASSKNPLVDGCTCYTCKNYSIAYICHLLRSSELLAYILLTMHNLHQWNLFFASAREAIRTDKWEEFKKYMTFFCTQ